MPRTEWHVERQYIGEKSNPYMHGKTDLKAMMMMMMMNHEKVQILINGFNLFKCFTNI